MWLPTLLTALCAAISLDLTLDIGEKSLTFIAAGQVHPALQPDYASSSPCHPVNQFIDTDSSDSGKLILNNTSSKEAISVFLTVASEEMTPSLSPNSLTLAPLQTGEVELVYGCGTMQKTAQIVRIAVKVGEETLEITYKKACGYEPGSRFDLSMLILLLLAVLIVALSSICASRPSVSSVLPPSESLPLQYYHAFGFILLGSLALVCLFFLGRYVIYVLTVFVSFSAFTAVTYTAETAILLLPASLQCPSSVSLPYFGPLALPTLISGCFSLSILLLYLPTHHWLLNNLIGICFVFMFLRAIKLPGFNIGALFLFLAFFYDIFWVFYSAPIFGGNVMVTVATSVDLPMKLEWLKFSSELVPDQCSMLGLGDMVLPGLLIAFCRKYDLQTGENHYFPWCLAAYSLALVLCGLALVLSQSAQPALLYISPCLVGGCALLGWIRGDLAGFWRGKPEGHYVPTRSTEVPLSDLRPLNS